MREYSMNYTAAFFSRPVLGFIGMIAVLTWFGYTIETAYHPRWSLPFTSQDFISPSVLAAGVFAAAVYLAGMILWQIWFALFSGGVKKVALHKMLQISFGPAPVTGMVMAMPAMMEHQVSLWMVQGFWAVTAVLTLFLVRAVRRHHLEAAAA